MKRFFLGLICCVLVHSAFAQINVIPKPTQVLTGQRRMDAQSKNEGRRTCRRQMVARG
jgi:hexosaminidase